MCVYDTLQYIIIGVWYSAMRDNAHYNAKPYWISDHEYKFRSCIVAFDSRSIELLHSIHLAGVDGNPMRYIWQVWGINGVQILVMIRIPHPMHTLSNPPRISFQMVGTVQEWILSPQTVDTVLQEMAPVLSVSPEIVCISWNTSHTKRKHGATHLVPQCDKQFFVDSWPVS